MTPFTMALPPILTIGGAALLLSYPAGLTLGVLLVVLLSALIFGRSNSNP